MKGIWLGKQLENIGRDGRWKILADLWTETILYVAPSDNARDHLQHLANGGEFLTHLWSLLLHAGILGREEQSSDEENLHLPDAASAVSYTHLDVYKRQVYEIG
ncbi:hypothetical protein BAE44_0008059 [Dichanthelium oligosanthes]|uniref:DUF4220 domain-containing protein n=1 Tax=Dichanthelium oligosanthes TaxID=888268 RepID=A0A1E5W0N8_9POAL|nr:hypothetical protein BAE44_0008059 [Dichanthelium oligosanthes]